MIAFFLLMLVTPIDKTIVTTAANPSGMAATAKLTATMNTSRITSPLRESALSKLTPKIIAQITRTKTVRTLLSWLNLI